MRILIILTAAAIAASLYSCSGKNAEAPRSVTRSAALSAERSYEKMTLPNAERAKALCSRLNEIDGVKEAYAVITGNTAIVGLVLGDSADESAVRRECEKTAKATDPEIDHVSVTTSPTLVNRVRLHYER